MRRRDEYMQMATGIGGTGDAGAHNPNAHSRVESAAIRIVELCEKIDRQADQYADAITQAEALISRVKNSKYREVLTLRYIECLPWRKITEELGYKDEKSAYRLHGWALQDAEKELHNSV